MKVLVLGDGLLGSELVNNYKWDMVSRKTGTLDITFLGLNELESTIKQYDVIVNCISNTDSYSEDKQKHWEVNYEFVKNLNNICSNKIKLVQISTEFVYAHNSIPPTEKCLPLPDNTWYAYTKLLADEYIQVSNSNYLRMDINKLNKFLKQHYGK